MLAQCIPQSPSKIIMNGSRLAYRLLSIPAACLGLICAAVSISAMSAPQSTTPDYKVVGKQRLDGPTRWDYLAFDSRAKRLYVTHLDQVDIFDTVRQAVVGHIAGTHGVHGVALAPSLDRGFTSNGKDGTVTIFALSSSEILGTVVTEKNPDAIVFDPASKRVFAAKGGSGSVTVIDAVGGRALKTIPLGGRPEFAAVDGKGRLFVNLEDKNALVVIDTATLAVTQRYDLSASCDEPAGLSIDPQRQVLFVGCHNRKMAIVDANTGEIVATVPIGSGSDATAFDAAAQVAFSSNGDGTLTVVTADKNGQYAAVQNVTTMRGARTMAVDPDSHAIYLVAAEIDHVDKPTDRNPRPRPVLKADSMTLITVMPGAIRM
jgi:YVTN family beta-propeller protein